jgi:hypothetical protein
MSMVGNLRRVSDHDINLLLKKPKHITSFLYGAASDALDERPGFLARLFGSKSEPPPEWTPRSENDETYLDKSWHGLHYLLTGTAWEGDFPANFLVAGGAAIGAVDVGYGPARALTSGQVRAVNEYLAGITTEQLRTRYDAERMSELEIYPEIWDEDESIDYLIENFDDVKAFVQSTAAVGQGLIIYIN